MTDTDVDFDSQDGAEVLDETNLTEDGTERVTFEEIDDDVVQDLTQLIGDADEDDAVAMDEDEFDPEAFDAEEDLDDDEGEDDAVNGFVQDDLDDDLDAIDLDAADGVAELEDDEVELEYAGDLMDAENAESGAQDLESEGELSIDDLNELGYRDDKP